MNLKTLIAKLRSGESLNALETAELDRFDPDALAAELAAAKERLDAAENAKLSNEEKLRKELERTAAERDDAVAAHRKLRRHGAVTQLAATSGFDDADYLDFLAGTAGVDPEDAAAAAEFVAKLRAESPGRFRATVKPGTGPAAALSSGRPAAAAALGTPDRLGTLVDLLTGAPDAAVIG